MKKIDKETERSDYYCDRCGKKFAQQKKDEKPDHTDFSVDRGACFPVPVVTAGRLSFEPKHLCGPCVVKFSKWWGHGKTK